MCALMNFRRSKLFRFQITFVFLFIVGMLLSIHLTRSYALTIESKLNYTNTYGVFYWLAPTFSIIQTGNLILLWGGALSYIAGVLVPTRLKYKGFNQLFATGLLLAAINLEFLLVSVLSTFAYEKIFIRFQVNPSFSILKYSLKMFFVTFLFLLFWSLLGYGIKLSFRYKILAILTGILVQIAEYGFIIFQRPSLEKYLPFALSRQLVVSQFRFWEPGSWAAVPGTIKYASTPMIVDAKYNILLVSPWWVAIFLFWYLSLVYILPIFRMLTSSKEVNDNINVNQ